jgi:hypothetical protein
LYYKELAPPPPPKNPLGFTPSFLKLFSKRKTSKPNLFFRGAGAFLLIAGILPAALIACGGGGGGGPFIPPPTHAITASVTGGGEVDLSHGEAAEGTPVTLTVTPDSGKTLKAGTLAARLGTDPVPLSRVPGASDRFTFDMPADDVTVSAEFVTLPAGEYGIIIPSLLPYGTLTTPPSYAPASDSVTVTIVPEAGYELRSVTVTQSDDNEFVSTTDDGNGSYTFTMPGFTDPAAVVTVDTEFTPASYTIAMSGFTNGGVTSAPADTAPYKSAVTLTVTPDSGYRLRAETLKVAKTGELTTTVTVNGSGNGPYTFTMPAYGVTVSAEFELIPAESVTVYAALSSDETGYAAKILKDGAILHTLPITSPDTENEITVLALSGSDIYAAGTGNGGGGKRGRIWKNGTPLFTPDGGNDTEFIAMAVSGSGVVYAGGNEKISQDNHRATYWKQDGTKTTLSSVESEVTGLAVAGTDVYAAGFELNNSSKMVAKIWKNGSLHWTLSDGTEHAEPHRIMVVGGDVYTAGYKTNSSGKKIAVIWKNNSVVHSLTDGSYDAHAFALTVVGSDVYAAGVEENSNGTLIAKIWKNNTVLYTFSNGANDAEADAIAVVGSDVYTAGYVFDSGSNKVRGTIWKNDSVVYTAPGSQSDTWISSIVVVEE